MGCEIERERERDVVRRFRSQDYEFDHQVCEESMFTPVFFVVVLSTSGEREREKEGHAIHSP